MARIQRGPGLSTESARPGLNGFRFPADRSSQAISSSAPRAQLVDLEDLRFRRQIAALHQRGPRLIAELLGQIARDRLLGTYIDQLLAEYLSISDAALDIVGGRHLQLHPLRSVLR